MNKSESIVELAAALSLAQKEMPKVKFNATNPFFKSKYADLGAIIETSKPILAKHGLSVSQLVIGATDQGTPLVGVETILMHKSGEWTSSAILLPLNIDMTAAREFNEAHPGKYEPKFTSDKNAAQEAGKTITYLRRYALSAILGMYADEDNDANEGKKSPQAIVEEAYTTPPEHDFKTRPYDAPTLRAAIETRAEDCKDATPKQRNLVIMLLSEFYFKDDDKRHEAQNYLLGASHMADCDMKKVAAMLNWMKAEKDSGGKYIMSEMALKELSAVTKALAKEGK